MEMPENIQIENLKKIEAALKEILAHMPYLKFEVKLDTNTGSDPCLSVNGILISCHYADKPTGFLGHAVLFDIGREVYYPGVMYYKDGSGEPPSTDYAELETDVAYHEVVIKALHYASDDELARVMENLGEEKMYDDFEIDPPKDEEVED